LIQLHDSQFIQYASARKGPGGNANATVFEIGRGEVRQLRLTKKLLPSECTSGIKSQRSANVTSYEKVSVLQGEEVADLKARAGNFV
jgi:hypothetical protein